jgi:hypothetical protein
MQVADAVHKCIGERQAFVVNESRILKVGQGVEQNQCFV